MRSSKRGSNAIFAAVGVLALFSVAGCSEQTKEAASNTVASAGQDTANHVDNAGKAVDNAGKAVDEAGTKAIKKVDEAGEKTAQAVDHAGEKVAAAGAEVAHDTKQTAKIAGKAVENTAAYTGEAVGGAVKGVAKAGDDAGKILTMTPTVKNALIKSSLDASTINVDTIADQNTIVLKGTVKSAAQKTQAAQVAMAAIKDANEKYRVKNELTVQP